MIASELTALATAIDMPPHDLFWLMVLWAVLVVVHVGGDRKITVNINRK